MNIETYKLQMDYIPDKPDHRDYEFKAEVSELPHSVDLRKYNIQIENQGRLGSCTANATVNTLELITYKHKPEEFIDLSRLFLYYNLREPYPNLKDKDNGAYLRDCYKMCHKFGIPPEADWPYIETKVNEKPPKEVYDIAQKRKVLRYERIYGYHKDWIEGKKDYSAILYTKAALAKGYPVLIGMLLTNEFFKMPKTSFEDQVNFYKGTLNGDKIIGGHAMAIVGYDDDLNAFIVENSWGKEWGVDGYCAISFDVMFKDCRDAWVAVNFMGIEFNEFDIPEFRLKDTKGMSIEQQGKNGNKFTIKPEDFVEKGNPPYEIEIIPHPTYKNDIEKIEYNENKTEATVYLKNFYSENYPDLYKATVAYIFIKIKNNDAIKQVKKTDMIKLRWVYEEKQEPKPKPKPEPKPKPKPKHKKHKKNKSVYIIAAITALIILLSLL